MIPARYLFGANLTTNATRMPEKAESLGGMGLDDELMRKRCFPVGDCERCSVELKTKSKTISEACDATGRRKKIECVVLREGTERSFVDF
jgi:hypothetical protein